VASAACALLTRSEHRKQSKRNARRHVWQRAFENEFEVSETFETSQRIVGILPTTTAAASATTAACSRSGSTRLRTNRPCSLANLCGTGRIALRLECSRAGFHLCDLALRRRSLGLRFLRETLGFDALCSLAFRSDLRNARSFGCSDSLLLVHHVAASAARDHEHPNDRKHSGMHTLSSRRLDALDLLLVLQQALLLGNAGLLLGFEPNAEIALFLFANLPLFFSAPSTLCGLTCLFLGTKSSELFLAFASLLCLLGKARRFLGPSLTVLLVADARLFEVHQLSEIE
jgi:hypothetical protein